ncbi:heterokaryon incompatibility protein-domain-containing protein [Xylaria bambusicola]|uniref:heterokaryon incompatibility protein-domain-containing protein n=1 Tax=Xylaria bambusicola TaxID=326684 RepID=UPI0020074202|nr:heterokaryon incompatibility protein-domain-containing protein [Xylaria bambusicola]KAI0514455.1 heterokaryon incompatibility protein-domain-containing protein [Xylaria bambusicola]
MHLLYVKTQELREFFGDKIPHYAILSHTWEEEEVTLKDLQTPEHKSKRGYVKIQQTCRLAARQAINSMFDWYRNAEVCFVFLADVPPPQPGEDIEETVRRARWLTRGWTLQEFLASRRIIILDSAWQNIKRGNFRAISSLNNGLFVFTFEFTLLGYFTGIGVDTWRDAAISTKLSWAARRQTSRTEDMAYCLLGLLDINMPLLYGEGTRAFTRLLEEVMKKSNSHDLLW